MTNAGRTRWMESTGAKSTKRRTTALVQGKCDGRVNRFKAVSFQPMPTPIATVNASPVARQRPRCRSASVRPAVTPSQMICATGTPIEVCLHARPATAHTAAPHRHAEARDRTRSRLPIRPRATVTLSACRYCSDALGQSAMARAIANRRSLRVTLASTGTGHAAQTVAMAATVMSRLIAPAIMRAWAALAAQVAGQDNSKGSGP